MNITMLYAQDHNWKTIKIMNVIDYYYYYTIAIVSMRSNQNINRMLNLFWIIILNNLLTQ